MGAAVIPLTHGARDVVMGARPDVRTASTPMTAFALTGLAAQLLNALASVPLRRPWEGPESLLHNVGITVTRTVMRAFLGHAGFVSHRGIPLARKALRRSLSRHFSTSFSYARIAT